MKMRTHVDLERLRAEGKALLRPERPRISFFTPEPTSFLKEMFPEIRGYWDLCPECRQRKTSRQFISTLPR